MREVVKEVDWAEVEQVILCRQGSCLLLRDARQIGIPKDLQEQVWQAALRTGRFVEGVNGRRLVLPGSPLAKSLLEVS